MAVSDPPAAATTVIGSNNYTIEALVEEEIEM